ncbi:2478_t:CDS:2 [Acaulospora colombiana]|uniref:2478_t:CDS:1 n=1 Tax=Acaulospora colombiana TaxID=27376 RepID=A0ACA9K6H1_9GLOM|nr:2478_t:CDS:2 [Acaulospora colombiana]
MFTFTQNNLEKSGEQVSIIDEENNLQNHSDQFILQISQQQNNWDHQRLESEMQELTEKRLVNHDEIIAYISKYDKLIEVKEEGAEIREFMESLSEEERASRFGYEVIITIDRSTFNLFSRISMSISPENIDQVLKAGLYQNWCEYSKAVQPTDFPESFGAN